MSTGEPENLSSGAMTDGREAGVVETLPRRMRGYDIVATDALLQEMVARQSMLESECAALRAQLADVEDELARAREREEMVSKALTAATAHAAAIRESAEREAETVLNQAHAESTRQSERSDELEQERENAERELERLHRLQQAVQTGLTGFLTQAIEQLRGEQGTDGENPETRGQQSPGETLVDADISPEAPTAG